jgi:rubrerythrin
MKKAILFLAIVFIAATAFAQQTAPAKDTTHHAVKAKQVQNPAAWACPKCYKITKEGGKCAADNTDMVQLGTYYCEHCVKATGNKPGKCPTCGAATTQMTRKLCAQHTGTSTKKAA